MKLDYDAIIEECQRKLNQADARIRQHEAALADARSERERIVSDLAVLTRLRDDLLNPQSGTEGNRSEYTVSEAAEVILRNAAGPMHVDQILPLLATYHVVASKQTLVGQLLRDKHRFRLLGRNVFELIDSEKSGTSANSISTNGIHTASVDQIAFVDNDEVHDSNLNRILSPSNKPTMADLGIETLRSIGHPVTTSDLKLVMVERGIVEDSKNLFPALHTALKRKPHLVRLGPGNQWILEEWINKINLEESPFASKVRH